MKKSKLAKCLLVSSVFAIISMILTYGYQCLNFYLDICDISSITLALMSIWSGLPLLISQAIFWSSNRIFKWYNRIDIFKVIILEMVLYIILMIAVFGYIPIPYELIPPREMAAGFGQLLTQIFAIATAILCGVVSGTVYWVKWRTSIQRKE